MLRQSLEAKTQHIPGLRILKDTDPRSTESLSLSIDEHNHYVCLDENGARLSRLPRIPVGDNSNFDELSALLSHLTRFRAVQAVKSYRLHSPLPTEMFPVNIYYGTYSYEPSLEARIKVLEGDNLTLTFKNNTDLPASYLVLCCNASWSVTTLWSTLLSPGDAEDIELGMVISDPVNEDDSSEIEDTIVLLSSVGHPSTGNLADVEFDEFDQNDISLEKVWAPIIPPPNWQISSFIVRTIPRGELDEPSFENSQE